MQCDFCDAHADIAADRCPSCHASFREECPTCGELKSIFDACANCPVEPASDPSPEWSAGPPATPGSIVLRIFGFLQFIPVLWSLSEGLLPVTLLCLAVLMICFVVARIRDLTEAMWRKLEGIEAELTSRSTSR